MKHWVVVAVLLGACSLDSAGAAPDLRDAALGASGGGSKTTAGDGSGNGSGAGGGNSTGSGHTSGVGGAAGTGQQSVTDGAVAPGDGSLEGPTLLDGALDGGPQGYVPGAVGAPCGNNDDCKTANTSSSCFSESDFAGLLKLPGGYCGTFCDIASSQTCEPGSACITLPSFPPILVCMRKCATDADCRASEGYKCKKPFANNVSVCALPQQP